MYSITLPLICDTSVYSEYPNKNFNECKFLKANRTYDSSSKILFKLPKEAMNIISSYEIIDATLIFYGCTSSKIVIAAPIYENSNDYCCSNVTWNNCPSPENLVCANPWIYNSYYRSTSCNVLEIIKRIKCSPSKDKGYQIMVTCENTFLELYSSNSKCKPYICLTFKPITLNNNFIEAYIDNSKTLNSIRIPYDGNIPFNTIDTNSNIFLDKFTNEITIKRPGSYNVEWWVNYSGAIGINTVTLSLKDSCKLIYSSNCPANSPGLATGHAIIIVSANEAKNNYKIRLCNTSHSFTSLFIGGSLYLSPIDMPASIRITSF